MRKKRNILDLGCGNKKIKNAIGLDIIPLPGVDIVHNMDRYPYPMKENTFEEIYCYHVLEHVEDMVKTMEEIFRIGKNRTKVYIRGPHCSCNSTVWIDPTHKRGLSIRMFIDYFSKEGRWSFYSKSNFKVKKIKLNYLLTGTQSRIPETLNRALSYMANLSFTSQLICERIWSYWVGGFEEIEVELEIQKP
ncbi:MAG: methyltransferase domain-containing protein [bacterium]|nr:methyltransferase domain-containing protein [bacterium]